MSMQRTFSTNPPLPDPISDVPHKVKEEISLWHTDDLVPHLDEQAEPLRRLHVQPVRNGLAEILRSCRGFHAESLKNI